MIYLVHLTVWPGYTLLNTSWSVFELTMVTIWMEFYVNDHLDLIHQYLLSHDHEFHMADIFSQPVLIVS